MSYRIGDEPEKIAERNTSNVTTFSQIHIMNGSWKTDAFPNFYIVIDRPEDVEKLKTLEKYRMNRHAYTRHLHMTLDEDKILPIHFNKEYYHYDDKGEIIYDKPEVEIHLASVDGEPILEGITAEAWIDEEEDWVVRVKIKAECPSAEFRNRFTYFTVVVKDDKIGYRYVPVNGVIVVWPAIL